MIPVMQWWERLDAKRQELGWSKAELARRSGIPYDNINKYLRGDIDQPRGDVLERLAGTIATSLLWLRDGIEVEATQGPALRSIPVTGIAEAGTFREVDGMDQSDPRLVDAPADRMFPHARQFAVEVSGDSMNALKPRPIMPGDCVICVSYEDIAGQVVLRDGMVVVVERTRDGGQTREWSVKQLEIYADRTEFHPRSTSPRHKPIVIERDMHADSGVTVEIIGLVRKVLNDMPLS